MHSDTHFKIGKTNCVTNLMNLHNQLTKDKNVLRAITLSLLVRQKTELNELVKKRQFFYAGSVNDNSRDVQTPCSAIKL
jgi:hypothetical protein